MRLVFAGTPVAALPSLEAVLGSAHEVLAVVTRPAAPAGRGRRETVSPIGQRAAAAGIEVLTPERPRDPDFVRRLVELAPDCCPVVAYGSLVPQSVLDVPVHGWVNLHFSLLPAWRGAAPVQHAVIAGDAVSGATTFRLEAGMDTGPVYGVLTETVRPTDTSGDLLARLADAGAGLLVATLDAIADGSITPRTQSAEGVSLAPKVQVADARIDWRAAAQRVDRLVRGCTPAPGAWTTWRGERLKLGPVSPRGPVSSGAAPEPGELRVGRRDVEVGTGTVAVQLSTVQPQGRRAMAAADWARGSRLAAGERFGTDQVEVSA